MSTPGTPTIAQIAAEAGVSVPTVSKVLNGRPDVAASTRAHVEEKSSGAARRAALEVLLAHRSGREAELVLVLDPLLTTNDPVVRAAAVDALAELRAPGAAATLEQRKEVEPDARVREAIEEALKTLVRAAVSLNKSKART